MTTTVQTFAPPAPPLSGGLEIRPSRDAAYLVSLFQDPEIYEKVADDHSMKIDRIDLGNLLEMPGVLLLHVLLENVAVGAFLLLPQSAGVLDVHTVLSPACRGRHAWRAARAALAYVFENTGVEKLVSQCPETNPPSLLFALTNGFRIVERKRDWLKRNVLYFSTHVELTRAMWKGTACQR